MNLKLLNSISLNKSIVSISISISISIFTSVLAVIFWLENTRLEGYINTIEQNKSAIAEHRDKLDKLSANVKKSNENLEKQIQKYIDDNYGELSERDEAVSKLAFLLEQQESRLVNIENALKE
jgi:cell division protein FtsB